MEHDARLAAAGDPAYVARSYGVLWRDRAGRIARGRLELGAAALRLVGGSADGDVFEEVDYADLARVRVGRNTAERIRGLRTVVLERCGGEALTIAGIAEPPGLIADLVERLTVLQQSHARRRVALVVPLVRGSRDAVRALLAGGPPFDAQELGLDRHTVFLLDDEAIFVFEWRGDPSVEALLTDPVVGQHASAWQEHVTGAPRIADPAYVWSRPVAAADEALLPPGLHA
jgi:hypothetical protein